MDSRTFNGRASSSSIYLVPLVALAAMYSLGLSLLSRHGLAVPDGTDLLWRFAFSLTLALYVRFDKRVRRFKVPFEFDAAVFFAWIVVVPYYLYRTRGRRGVLMAIGIIALAAVPYVAQEFFLLLAK
ncbi:MAG TPA: hypothetical protein VGS15_11380 [Candidatus Acidoferrales bacterium]|nr:hypothetical protein [Candidatus Acidoferrales bacterium]